MQEQEELLGANGRPKVWSEKLDGKNGLILQMFGKEATRPIRSMLIPPRGGNVQEWALYRQYHVASSLDEPGLGLFGPARKLHPGRWEQLGLHEEVAGGSAGRGPEIGE